MGYSFSEVGHIDGWLVQLVCISFIFLFIIFAFGSIILIFSTLCSLFLFFFQIHLVFRDKVHSFSLYFFIVLNSEYSIHTLWINEKIVILQLEISSVENRYKSKVSLEAPFWRKASRWRRNRTGRSLSLLQIHRKNNRTVNKVYKTTSDR